MSPISLKSMQESQPDKGKLQIQVKTKIQSRPIVGAKIEYFL